MSLQNLISKMDVFWKVGDKISCFSFKLIFIVINFDPFQISAQKPLEEPIENEIIFPESVSAKFETNYEVSGGTSKLPFFFKKIDYHCHKMN